MYLLACFIIYYNMHNLLWKVKIYQNLCRHRLCMVPFTVKRHVNNLKDAVLLLPKINRTTCCDTGVIL